MHALEVLDARVAEAAAGDVHLLAARASEDADACAVSLVPDRGFFKGIGTRQAGIDRIQPTPSNSGTTDYRRSTRARGVRTVNPTVGSGRPRSTRAPAAAS